MITGKSQTVKKEFYNFFPYLIYTRTVQSNDCKTMFMDLDYVKIHFCCTII